MSCFVARLATFAFLLVGLAPAIAKSSSDVLIVVDAAGKEFLVGQGQAGGQIVELPAEALKLAEQLKAQIGGGFIAQDGPSAPKGLEAFSKSVLTAIPDLFQRRSISVITNQILPLEMVRRGESSLVTLPRLRTNSPAMRTPEVWIFATAGCRCHATW